MDISKAHAMGETEKHFDKGYVLFRYSGAYNTDYIIRDLAPLLASASREELLNFRALIVDLNAVSEIKMFDSDVSINSGAFLDFKGSLDLKALDIQEIALNLQRLIICPTHLRGAWSERMERVKTAAVWRILPKFVFFDTPEAAVAAVNPV